MYTRLKRFITDQAIFTQNDSKLRLTLSNGAAIWFKTAEKPDNLYGEDVYAVVMDEFTRMKEEAWVAVRSTLTATQGQLKFIGNVKGVANWGYRLARKVEAGEVPGWQYYKVTADDAVKAGILAQEEIDQAKAVLANGVFLELYYGIPNENSSDKFCYSFDINKHVGHTEPNPAYPLYLSFDFNYNPISCAVIQDMDGEIQVHEQIKLPTSNIYNLCELIRSRYDGFHFIVTGDASGSRRT